MIDPESVDLSLAHELQNQRVRPAKNLLVLDAHGDQLVDVEEASIIDFFRGDLPERETEKLLGEKLIERIEAFRLAGLAVETRDVSFDEGLDVGVGGIKLPQHALDEADLRRAIGL